MCFLTYDMFLDSWRREAHSVCARSVRKIKDIVRSKLHPVEKKAGCRGFCKKSKNITDEFTSFSTEKTYKINHIFDCNDKYLIFLLTCKSSGKQYVGNTTNHFKSRWNNYKNYVRIAEKGEMENAKQNFF